MSPVQRKAARSPAAAPSAGPSPIQVRTLAQWTNSVWMKAAHGYPPRSAQPTLSPSGAGQAMPDAVQTKMERSFNADFSAIRIHEGNQAESIGARAFTRGTDIHFAPGEYRPNSTSGQELLGHELSHVVQQAQGRVAAPVQGKDAVSINSDAALESEADVQGARAAAGLPAFGGTAAVSPSSGGAVQRKAAEGAGPAAGGGPAAEGAEGAASGREPSREELEQMYPAEHVRPVAISAFKGNVAQAAYTAKRPLSGMPFMLGALHHKHIFFEDGGDPPDIGFMGPQGLGQDTSGATFEQLLTGLDDARMRQAVADVGDPGEYSLLGNNCQMYVDRVVARYHHLTNEAGEGQAPTMNANPHHH